MGAENLPAENTRVLAFADSLRRQAWALAARTPWGRRTLRERDLRLTWIALTQLALLFALTATAPLWLLLLSPLIHRGTV